MKVRALTGSAIDDIIDDLALLRISVFREWPYLYDGDLDYERTYLQSYQKSASAVVVGAFDGDWLVGAATGAPLVDHFEDFKSAFATTDIDTSRVYYCAESVLLPKYRGRGIGNQFFDLRERHARAYGFDQICFCSVMRPDDHPLRPGAYRPLDGFWHKRGYAPMSGVVAKFAWKDVDQRFETQKPLQFWLRDL